MSTQTDPGTSTATLIRIRLNLNSRDVRRILKYPGDLHQTVMTLAPESLGDNPRQQAGLLFRLEHAARTTPPTLLIQSRLPPDLTRLPVSYGTVETCDLTPMLTALTAGRRVRYRITANATVRRNLPDTDADARTRRTDVPLHGTDALDWWQRKATHAGLDPHTASLNPMRRSRRPITKDQGSDRQPDVFRHALTRFDGQATITDPDQLRHAVLSGIGRGKAYGAGLLSLAPA